MKEKIIAIVEMLVLAVAGVFLIIYPSGSLYLALIILGVALAACGVFSAFSFFLREEKDARAFSPRRWPRCSPSPACWASSPRSGGGRSMKTGRPC